MPRIEPQVSYRQFTKRTDLDALIRERIDKLDRYCDHIDAVSVVIERPNANPGGQRGSAGKGSGLRVRINMTVAPQHELTATHEPQDGDPGDDPRKVIRETFDIAERQLKKLVQKQRGE